MGLSAAGIYETSRCTHSFCHWLMPLCVDVFFFIRFSFCRHWQSFRLLFGHWVSLLPNRMCSRSFLSAGGIPPISTSAAVLISWLISKHLDRGRVFQCFATFEHIFCFRLLEGYVQIYLKMVSFRIVFRANGMIY